MDYKNEAEKRLHLHLQQLKHYRAELDRAIVEKLAAQIDLEASPEYQRLQQAKERERVASEDLDIVKAAVEATAEEVYALDLTHTKKQGFGFVEVQNRASLRYGDDRAIKWAQTYLPTAVKVTLMTRTFESEARKLLQSKLESEAVKSLAEIASIILSQKVMIASDLSELPEYAPDPADTQPINIHEDDDIPF